MTTLVAILDHGRNVTRDAELQREKLWAIASESERFFLVVVGIFKNEADILPEWLEHHLWQGVEHFFLIDNNSTDDWQSAVAPFAKHVSVRSDPVPYQQERHVTSKLAHDGQCKLMSTSSYTHRHVLASQTSRRTYATWSRQTAYPRTSS